jgi:hypothetical protein
VIPIPDRRGASSVSSWDRRPLSPPPTSASSYSRVDASLPSPGNHYPSNRHTWDEGSRPPSDVSSIGRDGMGYPPAIDYRNPSMPHRWSDNISPPAPSPARSTQSSSAMISRGTPNDAWPDPRDRRTPLASPLVGDEYDQYGKWNDPKPPAPFFSPSSSAFPRPWDRDS